MLISCFGGIICFGSISNLSEFVVDSTPFDQPERDGPSKTEYSNDDQLCVKAHVRTVQEISS